MLYTTLPKILFFDVETVSGAASYEQLDAELQALWQQKSAYWLRDTSDPVESDYSSAYSEKAGIYAEFGQVVCISMGILVPGEESIHSFRVNSIVGDNEEKLLQDFAGLLDKYYPDPEQYYLCGHNIREFDVPYIARRMIINGIKLPRMLAVSGKKPWETKFILDTLEMWKFGDYKNYTSLRLLAHILGIPSPKDDIDGSQVGRVYWEEKNLDRIRIYCEKDVVTTCRVFLRLSQLGELGEEQVVHS